MWVFIVTTWQGKVRELTERPITRLYRVTCNCYCRSYCCNNQALRAQLDCKLDHKTTNCRPFPHFPFIAFPYFADSLGRSKYPKEICNYCYIVIVSSVIRWENFFYLLDSIWKLSLTDWFTHSLTLTMKLVHPNSV